MLSESRMMCWAMLSLSGRDEAAPNPREDGLAPRCHTRHDGNAHPVTEMHEPASPAAEVFDEVAQAHKEAAAKLELLASHCSPDSPDQADLLGRAELERSLAGTATGRAEEARRLP